MKGGWGGDLGRGRGRGEGGGKLKGWALWGLIECDEFMGMHGLLVPFSNSLRRLAWKRKGGGWLVSQKGVRGVRCRGWAEASDVSRHTRVVRGRKLGNDGQGGKFRGRPGDTLVNTISPLGAIYGGGSGSAQGAVGGGGGESRVDVRGAKRRF